MAVIRQHAFALSIEPTGCRAVQLALQVAEKEDVRAIIAGLRGSVHRLISSPHGNYVIQKVVETAPAELCSFVAEELSGAGLDCARHRYGCRVINRLLEHAGNVPAVLALLDEVLDKAAELARHNFAHFVLEGVLEHGKPWQKSAVANALLLDLPRSARNRSASRVVEKALELCDEADRNALTDGLLQMRADGDGQEDGLVDLARSHFGTHVVRALAKLPGQREAVLGRLQSSLPAMSTSKNAQRLLVELGLAPRNP